MAEAYAYCKMARQLPSGDLHRRHHDFLHGIPPVGDDALFGRLLLEINQAGLSWMTILKKEDNFHRAYEGFSIKKIAGFQEEDISRLMLDQGIIRNRKKIEAAISNAKVISGLQKEYGSFRSWLDYHRHLSPEQWVVLFRKTFRFTGAEITGEFLTGTGFLPGAHAPDCPVGLQLSFAEKVIAQNRSLDLHIPLPDGIRAMNPFRENPGALIASEAFYRKYYNDHKQRRLILGINPGRHGAGLTGIPFTDTKRLQEICGLKIPGVNSHEPSSVFIYDLIQAYGGPQAFYADFYINSPSPLGFVTIGKNGKEINMNYYDSRELTGLLEKFMAASIRSHIAAGTDTHKVFCLGSGQNYAFLKAFNQRHGFFGELIPLEHPRFVMQYRSKEKNTYIHKFLKAFRTP